MTETRKQQLRAVLNIEGFTLRQIEAILSNVEQDPEEASKFDTFLSGWTLQTETKQ